MREQDNINLANMLSSAERKLEKAMRALKVIHIWADERDITNSQRREVMRIIAKKSLETIQSNK